MRTPRSRPTLTRATGVPPLLLLAGEAAATRPTRKHQRTQDSAPRALESKAEAPAARRFALLNALRDIPSTDSALRQAAADLAHQLR
jgi:hypothetical protein